MGDARNDRRRGPGWTDLMAAKPGPGEAALDDMRAEIAALRETVATQPAPVTQEALDALEARLAERLDRLPDASAAQAGRLEAAAERVEAVADGDRFAAIGETVSREHAVTRLCVTGIADVADVIAEDVVGLRRDLGNRTQTILARLPVPDAEAEADGAEADAARPRRRVWFVLWSLLLVAASMTLEAWTHRAWQFFHWLLQ